MPIEYARTASAVRPVDLSPEEYLNIGRLVRACAEIEDLIGLHLMRIANIGEGHLIVLLGRTSMSKKLELATTFAKATGDECLRAHHECFGHESFSMMVRCRNAVAHGLFLGETDEDKLAFRTLDVVGADTDSLTVNVISYERDDLRNYADLAEKAVPYIETRLLLGKLRRERRGRGLEPHRKGLASNQTTARPRRRNSDEEQT